MVQEDSAAFDCVSKATGFDTMVVGDFRYGARDYRRGSGFDNSDTPYFFFESYDNSQTHEIVCC